MKFHQKQFCLLTLVTTWKINVIEISKIFVCYLSKYIHHVQGLSILDFKVYIFMLNVSQNRLIIFISEVHFLCSIIDYVCNYNNAGKMGSNGSLFLFLYTKHLLILEKLQTLKFTKSLKVDFENWHAYILLLLNAT